MKKRGFGAGRWNGFGGKVEIDESVEDAAQRELAEESGLEVKKMTKVGILEFSFIHESDTLEVHVFNVSEFAGSIRETEEMKPVWFMVDEIPFGQMWPDDKYWFPLFLRGRKFRGKFLFADQDNIQNYELCPVDNLS